MINQERIKVFPVAHFRNVDDTILLLNPIIEKHGYKFIEENINQPKTILRHLLREIINLNNYRLPVNETVYILIKRDASEIIITQTDNYTSYDNSSVFDTVKYVRSLIQQLRLYKHGDIYSPEIVTIDEKLNTIYSKSNCIDGRIYGTMDYSILVDDIQLLTKSIVKDFIINKELKLDIAIYAFDASYLIENLSIAYINLITCLESLLIIKQDGESISKKMSNRISRLAYINNYPFSFVPKKLYGLRSDIVHGRKRIMPNKEEFIFIQDVCRLAINQCIRNNYDKKQLIKELTT